VTDPLAAIQRVYESIRFAEIVRNEAKRTVICSPAFADELTARIREAGFDDVITVQANPWLPSSEHVYVCDMQTIEAGLREQNQHNIFRPWRKP
jgi:hypothetical protein